MYHYHRQVTCFEKHGAKETVYFSNQWSSTSVESMTVLKHQTEATSYNRNNYSAANSLAVAASYNQDNTTAANIQAVAANDRLYFSSLAKTEPLAVSDSSNKTEEDSPDSTENTQKKRHGTTTCEFLIERYFAGEDIGVNSFERWLAEL